MTTTKLAALVALIALVLFLALPNLTWAAEDGAALFKAKCSVCHGADAAGKPAMKAPAIKGKSQADIKKAFASSPKHAGVKSLNDEQVKAIATYLQGLK